MLRCILLIILINSLLLANNTESKAKYQEAINKSMGLVDHISEIVPKITKEKFKYEQRPQAKLNKNFTLTGGKN